MLWRFSIKFFNLSSPDRTFLSIVFICSNFYLEEIIFDFDWVSCLNFIAFLITIIFWIIILRFSKLADSIKIWESLSGFSWSVCTLIFGIVAELSENYKVIFPSSTNFWWICLRLLKLKEIDYSLELIWTMFIVLLFWLRTKWMNLFFFFWVSIIPFLYAEH